MATTSDAVEAAVSRPSRPISPALLKALVRLIFILGTVFLFNLNSTTQLTAQSDIPWDIAVGVGLCCPILMLWFAATGGNRAPVSQAAIDSVSGLILISAFLGLIVGWWAYMASDYFVEKLAFRGPTLVRGDGSYPILRDESWPDKNGNRYYLIWVDPYGTGKPKKFKVSATDEQTISDSKERGYELRKLCLHLPVEQNGGAVRALVKQREWLPSGSVSLCPSGEPQGTFAPHF